MADQQAAGKVVSQRLIWRNQRYQVLKAQVEEEVRRYNAEYAVGAVATAQQQHALLGLEAAQAAIQVQFGPMGRYFNRINAGAVESMIGFARDGTPLHKLLREAAPVAVDGLVNALVNGIARGASSAQVAREMKEDGLADGLDRAMLIARTEMARAYRAASIEQYQQSGVVLGFKRLVSPQSACLACLALDGERFDLASELDDHPNGRCTAVPIVEGVHEPRWQTGTTWFMSLPAAEQRERMGDALYEAFRDGRFRFADLGQKQHSDVWGDSPRVPSLNELTGKER
jgi:SPP1 gp7 family putative phage head morphogenesis protein